MYDSTYSCLIGDPYGGGGGEKGRLLFLFYFNDLPSAAVNISAPFDDPKFYRVINRIPLMLFPYKPIGKCNFIALKASGITHKRYPDI